MDHVKVKGRICFREIAMKWFALISCLPLEIALAATPTITDVTAQQRYPWNGKVDITYRVTGDIAGYAVANWLTVSLKVTAIDRVANTSYAATAAALSGSTNLTEGIHAIVWDLDQQGIELKSTNVVFNVSCEMAEGVAPLYCVIDLSAGVNASSYPVTYLSAAPSGGFTTDDVYRTTKLVLRRIDAGSFSMQGSKVTLTKPFYMGIFEVTQKQWMLVMGEWPHAEPAKYYSGNGDDCPANMVSYDDIRGNSAGAGWPASSDVDATSFMGKLQARTGLNFDLPTEAQWEYACRAGTKTTYYWGDSVDDRYVWYNKNSSYYVHPVGTKKSNAWGLYDMSGNVFEWTLNRYSSGISSGTDPKGPTRGAYRVARGGGYWNSDTDCTSSHRIDYRPYEYIKVIGFRLSRTLP